jgi:2-polyprenyl-6-methoxyphenol hydroxylase-like FAD-dependent oxidoreductase
MDPPPLNVETDRTRCCVVGGGPAGIMLGYLLARAGVEVLVLEKHKDFFRDFRGDTIHPSTLELMHELGLLDEFLRQPHQKVRQIEAHFGDRVITLADFSHLPTRCQFIAFMPQWDFLNFLTTHARRLPAFRLRMESEVTDLFWEKERVVGVKARNPQGELHVRADLVIGADGRSSTVRERAQLEVLDLGAPIDVLWFRLGKRPGDPVQSFGHIGAGQFMVLLDRADYWQCAYVIRKGAFAEKQQRGLPASHEARYPTSDRLDEPGDREALSVKVIASANSATDYSLPTRCHLSAGRINPRSDAVAAARLLAEKLRIGEITTDDQRAVQQRRELPTRLTQRGQIFMHDHFLQRIFQATEPIAPPWPMRLLEQFPVLRRIPARMIGLGFRPEHVR